MSQVFEGYDRQYLDLSISLSRKCTAAAALDGGLHRSPFLFLDLDPISSILNSVTFNLADVIVGICFVVMCMYTYRAKETESIGDKSRIRRWGDFGNLL